MKVSLSLGIFALLALFVLASGVRAETIPAKYKPVVDKGLEYLAKSQQRDGHWEGYGAQYKTTMTALAGMALLMEGSTLKDGKYSKHIQKTTDWLCDHQMANGLIADVQSAVARDRYTYGHGFALLFLASAFGEEEEAGRRQKLEAVLTKAVEFTCKAQTSKGGWGYVSALDGGDFDEGSTTITQVQALRAARNAGIVVPKEAIDKARKYLQECTTQRGGVIYNHHGGGGAPSGGERAPITAAAICCSFGAGEYNSEHAKKWIKYCQGAIPVDKSGRDNFGHWEYTHYYYAQAIYTLGDDGYEKLFPKTPENQRLTWSKYREVIFDYLASKQSTDGGWGQGHIGNTFTTACYLTILQLDTGTLPIYQR